MKRFIVFVVNLTKFIVNKYYRYVFKMLLNTTFTNPGFPLGLENLEKPGKMGRHFPVREKSGNFEQTGKVREKSGKITQNTGKLRKFEINIT